MEVNTQKYLQSFKFPSSSSTIIGVTSPACPIYKDACYSYFHQPYDGNAPMLSFQYSEENSSDNYSADQVGPEYDMTDTLLSVVNPHLCKYCQSCQLFPDNCEDVNVHVCHTSNSALELSIPAKQDEQCSESAGCVSALSGGQNDSSGAPREQRKNRIKWTEELHRKFIECVDFLGGAKKATPKAILKLMGSEGLSIFHVKSHLQKYRIGKDVPEHIRGCSEKPSKNDVVKLCMRSNIQMKEALRLQLESEEHLREQLQIQQNLQRLIEEQSKQLKSLLEQNANTKLSPRT